MNISVVVILSSTAVILYLYYAEYKRNRRRGSSSSPDDSSNTVGIRCRRHDASFGLCAPSAVFQGDEKLMWNTQLPALRFVSDREPRGAYYSPLKLIYIELASRYPEIYEGATFQDWVEFYVRVDLFRFENDAIHITNTGSELLNFLLGRTTRDSVAVMKQAALSDSGTVTG